MTIFFNLLHELERLHYEINHIEQVISSCGKYEKLRKYYFENYLYQLESKKVNLEQRIKEYDSEYKSI